MSAEEQREIDRGQAANLLWEEFKFRLELFWSLYFRWGTAAITVAIIPFLRRETISPLTSLRLCSISLVYFFPAILIGLGLVATIHLASEYARLEAVRRRYDEILGGYAPARLQGRVVTMRIGVLAYVVFAAVIFLLAVAQSLLLRSFSDA